MSEKVPTPCRQIYKTYTKCLERAELKISKQDIKRYGCRTSPYKSCSIHSALYRMCLRTVKYGGFS